MEEIQIEEMKQYRMKLMKQHKESQLLLQLFLDSKEPIKKPAFEEMMKQIVNSQAKGPVATNEQALMSLDNKAPTDVEKLRKMIDYDILPEMELRLHSLIKQINQCLDDLVSIKDELPDEDVDKTEEEKNVDDERDIVVRMNHLQEEQKSLEGKLAESKKAKDKYKNACLWFDKEINEHIEKFGQLFLLNTVSPYRADAAESLAVDTEQTAVQQKIVLQEYQNKFTNDDLSEACGKIREIMQKQMEELSQTKGIVHSKLLMYVKDEVEMRKVAL